MAVDNPYTGGVSSLEDLARHRSLARNMRIAAKEAAGSRRQAYNVNSASEPMWETQARMRERMAWESAKHLRDKTGDPLSRKSLKDEFTVVRDSAATLQDVADEMHLSHERANHKTPFGGAYEPSTVLSGLSLYTVAQNAMNRLFYNTDNRKHRPSEAKTVAVTAPPVATPSPNSTKKNDASTTLPALGGTTLDSLTAKPTPKSEEKKAPAASPIPVTPDLYISRVIYGWLGKNLTQGDIDVDLTEVYNLGISKADQELYRKSYKTPTAIKSKPLGLHLLLDGKYDPDNPATQAYKISVEGTTYNKEKGTIALSLRAGKAKFDATCPFNPKTMVWQADGTVKIYPSEQARKNAEATAKSAVELSEQLS